MAKGIDLAKDLSPQHAEMMEAMVEQLVIVLLKRLGGDIVIPLVEMDDTGGDLLSFSIDGCKNFHFIVVRKN